MIDRDLRYDISGLMELAFGVKSPVFIPNPIELRRRHAIDYTIENKEVQPLYLDDYEVSTKDRQWEEGKYGRMSVFGTPVVFPMEFIGDKGVYKVYHDSGQLATIGLHNFELPVTSMADFTRDKILAETQQSSGEGNVVEMYGFAPWQIRIRGLCLDDPSRSREKTADEQKQTLLRWEKLADKIRVRGKLFAEKGISHIVVRSINLKQMEGRPDVYPFEIDAFSMLSEERSVKQAEEVVS
ncbi:MAG: DUF6046 domain-containing protein [Bacteroidetes bacterium]|nr:DUF6046 domain-containing protein [Bacteroidota bacterium]